MRGFAGVRLTLIPALSLLVNSMMAALICIRRACKHLYSSFSTSTRDHPSSISHLAPPRSRRTNAFSTHELSLIGVVSSGNPGGSATPNNILIERVNGAASISATAGEGATTPPPAISRCWPSSTPSRPYLRRRRRHTGSLGTWMPRSTLRTSCRASKISSWRMCLPQSGTEAVVFSWSPCVHPLV